MNSVRMLALSLCLVGLAACGPRPGDAPAAPETLTLAVQGMTCDGCVNFLTTDLAARPGVTTVAVSLENEEAVVVCDPRLFNLPAVALDLQKKGYTLTRK